MTKPEEFCKDKLFRVTAVQDMKLYNNRIDNLCKREKKCKKIENQENKIFCSCNNSKLNVPVIEELQQ